MKLNGNCIVWKSRSVYFNVTGLVKNSISLMPEPDTNRMPGMLSVSFKKIFALKGMKN
jgi:hypothetical protein